MRFAKILILAGLVAAATSVGARAQTCGLGLMASLDMTVMPNGLVTVPVSINGTTHRFVVDTAGIFSKIASSVAQSLGLKEVETGTELYSPKGRVKLAAADIASLKIGANEAKHFHLAVTDEASNPASGVDGVLAADLLQVFDVEFDFAAKKMNFFSQDHCPGKVVYWTKAAYAELPFHMTSGPLAANDHIQLTTTLDGQDLITDLDTGSSTTWLRRKAAIRSFALDENSPGMTLAPYKENGLPVYRKKFGVLRLAGVDVRDPTIDVIDDQFDAAFRMAHSEKSRDDPVYGSSLEMEPFTLGMDVLSKLHLYIAYKEHKVYATAADAH